MRLMKRLLLPALALMLLALLALALRPRPVDVEVAHVVRGHFEETILEDGKTRVRERYTVAAPIAGTLLRIGLKAGDAVTAEAVVASILPNPAPLLDARARQETEQRLGAAEAAEARTAALVAQAEATATQARVDERSRTLVAQGAAPLSRQERDDLLLHTARRGLEAARFAHHVAEHEVELARATLAFDDSGPDRMRIWQVRSPVGGHVLRVLQESQSPVDLGAPLVEIGDTTDIEVVADFLTNDAVRIHPGDTAWIEDWGGDSPLAGRVRRVEPGGFTKVSALGVDEQRTNVVIDIIAPPDERPTLGDAFRVDAQVVVAALDNAIVIPAGALFRDRDGWATFVASDGVAHKRTVRLSHRSQSNAAVLDGVQPGEAVILFPTDAIANGVRVKTR
jgi:HlyD family secretion protein